MFRTHRSIRCTVLVATAALTLGMSAGAAHALDHSNVVVQGPIPFQPVDPPVLNPHHPFNPCDLIPTLCDPPRGDDTTTTTVPDGGGDTTTTVPSHPTGDPDPVPDPTPPTVIVHASPNFTG